MNHTKHLSKLISILFCSIVQLHAAHALPFPQIIQKINKHQACNHCQQLISGYTRNTLTQAGYIKGVLKLIFKYYHSVQTVEATPTFMKVVNNITQHNPSFNYWIRTSFSSTFDVEGSCQKNIEVWVFFSFQGSLLVNNTTSRTAMSTRTKNFISTTVHITYSSFLRYCNYENLQPYINKVIKKDIVQPLQNSPQLNGSASYQPDPVIWIYPKPKPFSQQKMEPLTQDNINRILSQKYVRILAIIDIDIKKADNKIIAPNP